MSYSLAIFDFDGTLANSFAQFIRALNDAADKYTFRSIGEREIEVLRQQDASKALKYLGVGEHKLPFISRYVRSRMMKDISQISLFEGADHLLEQLAARGVMIAIISASRPADVRRLLGTRNEKLVQHFACGAAFLSKRLKLRQIVRRSNVVSLECILIGDQITDLLAARAENISFGAVSWGFNSGEALKKNSPDFQFESMGEVLQKVPWRDLSKQ
jgi:phosphoglycolate phosphatase